MQCWHKLLKVILNNSSLIPAQNVLISSLRCLDLMLKILVSHGGREN